MQTFTSVNLSEWGAQHLISDHDDFIDEEVVKDSICAEKDDVALVGLARKKMNSNLIAMSDTTSKRNCFRMQPHMTTL